MSTVNKVLEQFDKLEAQVVLFQNLVNNIQITVNGKSNLPPAPPKVEGTSLLDTFSARQFDVGKKLSDLGSQLTTLSMALAMPKQAELPLDTEKALEASLVGELKDSAPSGKAREIAEQLEAATSEALNDRPIPRDEKSPAYQTTGEYPITNLVGTNPEDARVVKVGKPEGREHA